MKSVSTKENSCRLLAVVKDRNGCITISAIYSPPRHTIKREHYISFFKTLSNRFIAAGDYNAKYTYWGSRLILPKGHELFKAVEDMNLATGELTYWPSDDKKIPDLLDFGLRLSGAFLKISVAPSPVSNCAHIILL